VNLVNPRPAPYEQRKAVILGETDVVGIGKERLEIAALAAIPPEPLVDLIRLVGKQAADYGIAPGPL
jgi:hypothetical protein